MKFAFLLSLLVFGSLSGCGGAPTEQEDSIPVVNQKDWRKAPAAAVDDAKKSDESPKEDTEEKAKDVKQAKKETEKKSKPSTKQKRITKRKPSSKAKNHPDRFEIVEASEVALVIAEDENGAVNRDQFLIASLPTATQPNQFKVVRRPTSGTNQEQISLPSGIKLPKDFDPAPGTTLAPNGWPRRIICSKDNSEMVLLPGGVSLLGSDSGPSNSRPAIKVTINPFYMDVTEVTLEQYETYREEESEGRNQAFFPEPLNAGGDPREPVLGCWFRHAELFAKWTGKELPTEAEWEHAARGNDGAKFPWREGFPVWNQTDKHQLITTVASEKLDRTPEGIFDLSGNALEWCSDWYYENTFEIAADKLSQPITQFTGPRKKPREEWRVVKGGGEDWSAWTRRGIGQKEKVANLGFRCVLHLPNDEEEN